MTGAKYRRKYGVPASFVIAAITLPTFFDGEAGMIAHLLGSGFDFVHIRKPDAQADDVRRLLDSVPPSFMGRLRIHYHAELAAEYGLAGVHLNARCSVPPSGIRSVTRSCHSLEELAQPVASGLRLDYQTLSPIYDSISKPGYLSAFPLNEITGSINGLRVIALGGVTPNKLSLLADAGFYGAAMLGAAWRDIRK